MDKERLEDAVIAAVDRLRDLEDAGCEPANSLFAADTFRILFDDFRAVSCVRKDGITLDSQSDCLLMIAAFALHTLDRLNLPINRTRTEKDF